MWYTKYFFRLNNDFFLSVQMKEAASRFVQRTYLIWRGTPLVILSLYLRNTEPHRATVSAMQHTYLGVAGGDAGQTRGHGASGGHGGVRTRRDHRRVNGVMRQERGGMRVRGKMRMLWLRMMQLWAGRCTLHHHWNGRRPNVDRSPAATLATGASADDRIIAIPDLAAAERFVQVLSHLVLLLLHHVVARWILQQRAHLTKRYIGCIMCYSFQDIMEHTTHRMTVKYLIISLI